MKHFGGTLTAGEVQRRCALSEQGDRKQSIIMQTCFAAMTIAPKKYC